MVVASPLVYASWGMNGSSEPDTPHDVKDGWMFLNPDTSPDPTVNKVYFNGFMSANQGGFLVGLAGGWSGNPNLATAHTAIPLVEYDEYAILGVWKDCNRDGFVGLGDQGLWEYRSTLLLDTSVCPAQSVPNPIPANWMPVHNDGEWVHELTPITWYAPSEGVIDFFAIHDNGARVWYDTGMPDVGGGGRNCWLNPPTGSMHSTGGILWWADCIDGYQVTDTIDTVAAVNPALAPLSFSDHPRDQYNSKSVLNQPNPWGSESDPSDAQAWDCSKPQLANEQATDPTGTLGTVYLNLSTPNVPPTVTKGGTPAGTANATASGLDRCDRRTDTIGGGRGGAAANAPYVLEAPVTEASAKITSSGVLAAPETYNRPFTCLGDLDTYPIVDAHVDHQCNVHSTTPAGPVSLNTNLGSPTGAGTPPGFGQHFTTMDGVWFDGSTWTSPGALGTSSHTYYAYVSPAAVSQYGLQLPKGTTTGSYGAEFCGTATTGDLNGWDCNAKDWWLDTGGKDASWRSPYLGADPSLTAPCTPGNTTFDGEDSGPGSRGCVEISPYPGSPYNLRDVDCYDYSNDQLRHALGPESIPSPVGITENGCPTMT
jgi:hypothetical protein